MKISYRWEEHQMLNELIVIANPKNKKKLEHWLTTSFENKEQQLQVINPKNNRHLFISLHSVEIIESFGHLCQVITQEEKVFFY